MFITLFISTPIASITIISASSSQPPSPSHRAGLEAVPQISSTFKVSEHFLVPKDMIESVSKYGLSIPSLKTHRRRRRQRARYVFTI
jgi:hypothetical protein